MSTYFITTNNRVVSADSGHAGEHNHGFGSKEELAAVTEHWPAARLVAIWNELPSVKPVRRFTDRATAVRRIWAAVQVSPSGRSGATEGAQRASRRTKAGNTERRTTGRKGTKTEKILAMLRRPAGATLPALMRATHWQAHSVRGFLSGQVAKKLGLEVKSTRESGQRVYTIQG